MQKFRRTKIVTTLGPSSNSEEMLLKMLNAGVNVIRCNFSHGSQYDHKNRIEIIRKITKDLDQEIAIIADLQGPKIRISRFKDKKIFLKEKEEFVLDADLDKFSGDKNQVGIDYKELIYDVAPNDTLLLDDGLIVLRVLTVEGQRIVCRVIVGGELSDNKGINRLGGGLSAKALTKKDKEDLLFASQLDIDYFAISFPRNAGDVEEARNLIRETGSKIEIISKIERIEAVEKASEIISASDAIMIARGDLGVEIGDENVPAVQKKLIKLALELGKPVITATQMMDSMKYHPIPTRAEVSDVANAILDGTDAVMLSAESATGNHPHLVVQALARISLATEKKLNALGKDIVQLKSKSMEESISYAAMFIAQKQEQIKAIIAITEFGKTPLIMSRINIKIPIFALTRHLSTKRKMNLYRGVHSLYFDVTSIDTNLVDDLAANLLYRKGIVSKDDLVIIVRGDILGEPGFVNTLKIHKIQ